MKRTFGFDRQMEQITAAHQASGVRPLLLLHVCCAPCSCAVLERLHDTFRVAIHFDNPNMDTEVEYALRAAEARRLAEMTGWAEQFILAPYDPASWQAAVRGMEDEPEGGARCAVCFRLRLHRAALLAKELDCEYFTTTLTLSPRKDATLLNRIGMSEGEAAGVAFLPSDFKKRGGYDRSLALSRQFSLYRQNYCGCVYSRRPPPSLSQTADATK